jgi:hypothetical protein
MLIISTNVEVVGVWNNQGRVKIANNFSGVDCLTAPELLYPHQSLSSPHILSSLVTTKLPISTTLVALENH